MKILDKLENNSDLKIWSSILLDTQQLEKIKAIAINLEKDINLYPTLPIYPLSKDIFKCFTYFAPQDTKVVIIGQDCYHGENQATGLAFGIPTDQKKIPPSLRNIKKELENDLQIVLEDLTLERWAKQGVLLLNSSLTVRKACAGSHLKIWKDYTDQVIINLSNTVPNIIFMLWGRYAQQKEKLISTTNNHLILKSSHPSPLSANKGGWFNNNHFSLANKSLLDINKTIIEW